MILPTLNSVFNQTYQNFEVIVVDNCSTDNTLEVLDDHIKNEKIRFIQHDKNYERAKSRNTGLDNATGEYVTFLDSDDYLYPNCLQEAFEYTQSNPDSKLFHCLYELVDSDLNRISGYTFPSEKKAKEKKTQKQNSQYVLFGGTSSFILSNFISYNS